MRIKSKPNWNESTKTVSLELTGQQWEDIKRYGFKGQWHFLRFKKHGVQQACNSQ